MKWHKSLTRVERLSVLGESMMTSNTSNIYKDNFMNTNPPFDG